MAKGKLRKLFTTTQIEDAVDMFDGNPSDVAAELSVQCGQEISRQLASYWIKQLEIRKKNGDPYESTVVIDRHIRESMTLRVPSKDDDAKLYPVSSCNDRILIIPDLHAPYHHPDSLEFLIDVTSKLYPTRVINLGDETDGHAMSMHDSDPNLDSAGVELAKAKEFLQDLARLFPVMDICHSNHGSLIYRRAFKFGIPVEYIKTYRDILFPEGGGDGWSWHEKIPVTLPNGDLTIFQHQSSGDILNNAAHERANIVQGHEHGDFFIRYRSSTTALYWAMVSGCLIDRKALAFKYGKLFPKKPIVGVSAIIDSQPMLLPMPMDTHGRYTGKLTGAFA